MPRPNGRKHSPCCQYYPLNTAPFTPAPGGLLGLGLEFVGFQKVRSQISDLHIEAHNGCDDFDDGVARGEEGVLVNDEGQYPAEQFVFGRHRAKFEVEPVFGECASRAYLDWLISCAAIQMAA